MFEAAWSEATSLLLGRNTHAKEANTWLSLLQLLMVDKLGVTVGFSYGVHRSAVLQLSGQVRGVGRVEVRNLRT